MSIRHRVLAVLLGILFMPGMLFAAQQGGGMKQGAAQGGSASQSTQEDQKASQSKRQDCKEMMARHEKYKKEMDALDKRLNEKVEAMNAAKGDQKTAAMAEVINEMAAQRKEMREMFASMHHGRMGGMMRQGKSQCAEEMREHMSGSRQGAGKDTNREGSAG